jgi:hypothetical protein
MTARNLLVPRRMETQRSPIRSMSRRDAAAPSRRSRRPALKSPVPASAAHSDAWWDVDAELLSALAGGAKSIEELSASLAMSREAVTSLVAMLAQQGKLRIEVVAAVA